MILFGLKIREDDIMQFLEGLSWILGLLVLIGLFYGVQAAIGYRAVARDARSDYAYKKSEGMIDKRLSEEGYIRAYKRFNNPRRPAYIASTIAAILLLTWPAMGLIELVLRQAWQFSGRSRTIEPGFLVWQFFIFFSIIGIWVIIAYLGARRYHRFAPISFHDEQIKEME